jgi:hypothetical protein
MINCKHIFPRGKFQGESCKQNGLHNGYCHKHKKKVVPEHIVNEVAGKAAEPKKKYKFSAFRWTINSNTSSVNMTADQVKEFKRLIGFIFSKDKIVEYLVDKAANDPRTNLDELDTAFFFEIAPTTHALHAHGVVKLKHHGMYSLSTDVIREIVAGVLGKKVHINVQASGDADAAWAQYMTKNQQADKL